MQALRKLPVGNPMIAALLALLSWLWWMVQEMIG
jgi:hypothetical protein